MVVTNVAEPPKKTASCKYENNLKVKAYIWMMYANNKYINAWNPIADPDIKSIISPNIVEKRTPIFSGQANTQYENTK